MRVLLPLAATLLLSAPVAVAQSPAQIPAESPRLVFTASGDVSATADEATLSIRIENESSLATDAVGATAAESAAVIKALKALGVGDSDIRSAVPNVQRRPADKGVRTAGYRATGSIQVKVRDLSRVGAVYEAVTRAGADAVSDLAFGVSDLEPLRSEARREAMQSAERTAAEFSRAGGWKSIKLVQVTELPGSTVQGFNGGVASFGGGADGAPTTMVSPSDVTVTVRLQMTYAFER